MLLYIVFIWFYLRYLSYADFICNCILHAHLKWLFSVLQFKICRLAIQTAFHNLFWENWLQ